MTATLRPTLRTDPAGETEVIADDTTIELPVLVASTARNAAKKYREFVDYEDVLQEVWVYALSAGAPHIARWTERGERHRVYLALAGVAKGYCEVEKAQKSGYNIADVAWYSPDELADLIPLALDPEFEGIVTGDEDDGGPRRQVDAAEGGTLLAMIADVRRALYAIGKTLDLEGLTAGWFDTETEDGMANLTKVADFLGGEYPGAPGYSRGRRAISNAAAAVQIRRATGDLVGSEA